MWACDRDSVALSAPSKTPASTSVVLGSPSLPHTWKTTGPRSKTTPRGGTGLCVKEAVPAEARAQRGPGLGGEHTKVRSTEGEDEGAAAEEREKAWKGRKGRFEKGKQGKQGKEGEGEDQRERGKEGEEDGGQGKEEMGNEDEQGKVEGELMAATRAWCQG